MQKFVKSLSAKFLQEMEILMLQEIEKKVKTQEVKQIHKMSQRPEIPRRYL